MTYLYIYLVGFIGFAAWLAVITYKDKRDGFGYPPKAAFIEAVIAVLLWPAALVYVAIIIGMSAWDRRGY